MTNEEAIRIATGLRTDFKCESDTMVDFCNTVIKALKQENILDKLYADIKEERKVGYIPEDVNMWDFLCGLDRALSIIDEYKRYKLNKEDMDSDKEQEEEKE